MHCVEAEAVQLSAQQALLGNILTLSLPQTYENLPNSVGSPAEE